jgi:hypothetical protein
LIKVWGEHTPGVFPNAKQRDEQQGVANGGERMDSIHP